jgi:uncharacterized protein (DUF427 family)
MQKHRIEPGPDQESVWDYPRPPRLEKSQKHIQVVFNNIVIADTHHAMRILETSQPPVYYIPPQDIQMKYLISINNRTYCEWKGIASYYTLKTPDKTAENAAWYYAQPNEEYTALTNCVAFYPSLMDACYVDGEKVQAQAGDFYGGWITHDIVGPFKGGPGTYGW